MRRTHVGIALAATVVGAGIVGGCKKLDTTAEAPAAEPVITVGPENIAIVTTTDIRSGPAISGSLQPIDRATLRAEVAGSVQRMDVDAGQRVKAGQVLARLDDTAVRDAFLSAKSALHTAEASLENARRNAERATRLAAAGALPERELENARLTVTSSEGIVADARARLALAEKQLNNTIVRAPFAGIVSDRPADPGDIVQVGTPLITVVEPRRLRLEAAVPAEQVGRLSAGMAVEFAVAGFEQRFTGKIERINPVVDSTTRQVRIYVAIPNAEQRLVAGLFAEGRVATAQTQALAVPGAAVDERGIAPIVRRIANGRVAEATVTLGVRDEVAENVEIRSGIAEGDTVLVGTSQAVTPGVRIRVLQPQERAPAAAPAPATSAPAPAPAPPAQEEASQ